MVLSVVHVVSVGIRRNTLPQESFMATCFGSVSCLAIIVGPSTEKEGLGWKTTKMKRMMTAILCPLNTVVLQWKTMMKKKQKNVHHMSQMMILVGPLLMQRENVIAKGRG